MTRADPIRTALERLIEALDAPVAQSRVGQWTANLNGAKAAARTALAEQQGEKERRWTEGICGDGAAILFDGVMVPVDEVVRALNCHRLQPPAEGEVGYALLELRSLVAELCDAEKWIAAQRLDRAADLLEQQHPTPVPVSERLPGAEDCDAEGRCWWIIEPYPRPVGPGGRFLSLVRYCPGSTHWLPAHALPMPQGEVE